MPTIERKYYEKTIANEHKFTINANKLQCKHCGQSLESLKTYIKLYGHVYPTFSKYLYNFDLSEKQCLHTIKSNRNLKLELNKPLNAFDNSSFSINFIDYHQPDYNIELDILL